MKIQSTIILIIASQIILANPIVKKVTYEFPVTWKVLKTPIITDTSLTYLHHIHTDTIDNEAHFSNSLLRVFEVPDSVSLKHADGIVAYTTKTATHILAAEDGKYWKTYLFVNNERNQQYIIMYRIGIKNGICAEFMLAFPHIRDGTSNIKSVLTLNENQVVGNMAGIYCSSKSVRTMALSFNSFCENLKLFGENQYLANIEIVEPPNEANVYRDKSLDK